MKTNFFDRKSLGIYNNRMPAYKMFQTKKNLGYSILETFNRFNNEKSILIVKFCMSDILELDILELALQHSNLKFKAWKVFR